MKLSDLLDASLDYPDGMMHAEKRSGAHHARCRRCLLNSTHAKACGGAGGAVSRSKADDEDPVDGRVSAPLRPRAATRRSARGAPYCKKSTTARCRAGALDPQLMIAAKECFMWTDI